ncbi:sulfur carrier protein ThiS [Desulfoluna spongiiphila]|uniref:Thiazole synthase/sulfur carrier protein n=1 Tax=Desulfoluna spongiiphila TaxID=419481 RepID=A0A1G5J0J3_9BACT|nr:sulfur carrier protein ThiS [Desulfoluna spongiiphila]SCY81349.1 thiazole synthase/sulfur carrier protein [Desulfoluna spongiiphila]VVS91804.1 this thiamine-biosynthesis [Desulfoluna spongiiphila]
MMVNGSEENLSEGGMTLERFLENKGLPPGSVVVERNGEVVERSRFGAVTLDDTDNLEILRFVGGGC